MPGLFVLAMGKMGAGELNYSSDIDLIVLFDLDVLPVKGMRVKEAMTRVARSLVRMLDERTVDGYVFRTDLRLRPDPSSTSPAVSTQFALGYYESVGQNWERMAHIKARVCAGDRAAGEDYLRELSHYVWRRHLDYWAIADVHSIKRQIHAHGGHAELDSPEFDVKLGRGGIREIEFFAQVQQLILGGRITSLRAPRTKDALAAMVEAQVIAAEVAADLSAAYDFLRAVEHRVQMLNDEQTHHLPDRAERRDAVRAMAGYPDAGVVRARHRGCAAARARRLFRSLRDRGADFRRGGEPRLHGRRRRSGHGRDAEGAGVQRSVARHPCLPAMASRQHSRDAFGPFAAAADVAWAAPAGGDVEGGRSRMRRSSGFWNSSRA